MNKKLITTIMITLFLASIAMIAVPNVHASPTEWHVYPGDSIQAVIDVASPYDTIIVHAGTYAEHIIINKDGLTLLGEQQDVDPRPAVGGRSGPESIIDTETNHVPVYIDADNVVLNGFTIRLDEYAPGSGDQDLVYQDKSHSGTVVKYNIITSRLIDGNPTPDSDDAIQLKKCTNGVIEYNYAHHVLGNGFNFASSTNCVI